jgi:hypothetical protein
MIAAMSEEDILREQAELRSAISAKTLALIQKRGQRQEQQATALPPATFSPSGLEPGAVRVCGCFSLDG